MTNSELDKFDYKILNILKENGRITLTELSSRVGLSATPCQARMRKLERDGYIQGYRAVLNPERLDLSHVAFVQVKLSDTKEKALRAFSDAVVDVREVEQCHMIAGGFDYLLKVRTKDIGSYRKVLGEQISGLPHVAQTSTFVVMETVLDQIL